jgi:hypothetical protein
VPDEQPKKRFFKPHKPVSEMSHQELEEFASFVYDTVVADFKKEEGHDDDAR